MCSTYYPSSALKKWYTKISSVILGLVFLQERIKTTLLDIVFLHALQRLTVVPFFVIGYRS
jgi:hypothetical protein